MSLVAISETMGSLGVEIGRTVATKLGYQFADREIIMKAAERYGGGLLELTHATEEKPSLLERFSEAQRRYMAYVEATILETAARDNAVLIGRASTIILRGVLHALRVRITAPEPVRARRVQEQGLTPDSARNDVRQSDRERGARVRFFYHVDWEDPLLYDLVLNTDLWTVEEGARVVQETLRSSRFASTSEASKKVTDLSIGAQAKASLLANPATRDLQLVATCMNGHLVLGGIVERDEQRRVAQEIVSAIPGVTDILNEIAVIPRRTVPGV